MGLQLGLSWLCSGGCCSEHPPQLGLLELTWGPAGSHCPFWSLSYLELSSHELFEVCKCLSCELRPCEDFSHAAQPRDVFL